MKTLSIILFLSLLCWQTGCSKPAESGHDHGHDHGDHAGHDHGDGHDAHAGHDHDGHDHGSDLLEVGAHVAHIKFDHDHDAGAVTLSFTGPDAKTALLLTAAPKLNLTGDNPLQLETTAVSPDANGASAVFTASDEALKAEPEGRIAVTIGDQSFQVVIAHEHHDHE
jgi:hypothetical protein